MRPIRFRVWYESTKTYIKDLGIAYESWVQPDGVWTPQCLWGDLEQFTGLTDRNGVDIYEGDIVTWEAKGGVKGPFPMRVEYLEDRSMFGIATDKTFDTFEDYMDISPGPTVGECFIVVGNVHEHPHLLLPPS